MKKKTKVFRNEFKPKQTEQLDNKYNKQWLILDAAFHMSHQSLNMFVIQCLRYLKEKKRDLLKTTIITLI